MDAHVTLLGVLVKMWILVWLVVKFCNPHELLIMEMWLVADLTLSSKDTEDGEDQIR